MSTVLTTTVRRHVFQLSYRVGRLALVAYLLLVTFPGQYSVLAPGLDASWQFGINYLVGSSHVYGRDVVFTYGPLGYLLFPLDIGSNLLYGVVFRIGIHILFAAALTYHAWTARSNLAFILFVPPYVVISAIGLQYESHLLIVLALLISVCIAERRLRLPVLIIASMFASSLLFMKFSLGLSALLIIGVCLFSLLLTREPKFWQLSLVAVFAYLLVAIILVFTTFVSVQNLVLWLRASLDLSNGYSTAMSLVGPDEVLITGLLSILVYGLVLLVSYTRRWPQRFTALTLLPAVLLAFKNGFVRQDGHVFIFFPFILAAFCVQMLSCVRKSDVALTLSAFLIVLGGSFLTLGGYFPWVSFPTVVRGFTAPQGLDNIRALADLGTTKKSLKQQSTAVLQQKRLPMDWVDQIKQNSGAVDALPWELGYMPANFLRWDPNPLIQTYAAYTAYLDSRSAGHFLSPSAPEHVIVELPEIDGRHPFFSAPSTWYVLLHRYEVVELDLDSNRLLLRQRTQPLNSELRTLRQETIQTRQWVNVPQTGGLVVVELDMRPTPMGRLAKQLFRIPPVNLDLIYESGAMMSYRMIPDNATNGIVISGVPIGTADLGRLFSGVADDRVAQFRISGSGISDYENTVNLTWQESRAFSVSNPTVQIDLSKLQLNAGETHFGVDTVNGQKIGSVDIPIAIDRARNEAVIMLGWAVDSQAHKGALGVFVSIDDEVNVRAKYGLDRVDVAQYLNDPAYRFSGWSAMIPMSSLTPGRHTLKLKVVSADGQGYFEPEAPVIIQVQ